MSCHTMSKKTVKDLGGVGEGGGGPAFLEHDQQSKCLFVRHAVQAYIKTLWRGGRSRWGRQERR